jgi:hypothetical protein
MRLTSTGLGIGTSSPSQKLDVYGNAISVRDGTFNGLIGRGASVVGGGGAADLGITTTTGNILFSTGGSFAERMRLDPSGNLGLGVTPSAWFSGWSPAFEMRSFALASDANTNYICNNAVFGSDTIWRYVASKYALHTEMDAATGQHRWYTAPSGTAGNAISFTQAMTLDASGNLVIGNTFAQARLSVRTGSAYAANFNTSQTSNTTTGITLGGYESDAPGSNGQVAIRGHHHHAATTASSMSFMTHDGSNLLERARIDSSGRMQIGTTATKYSAVLTIVKNANSYNITSSVSSTASSGHMVFENNNADAVGTIFTAGSTTSYNTSSDYRLKNITGPITNSGAYIDSLNPVEGTWKADGSTFVGLIAHEVQKASRTNVATGTKDGEQMQGMDYSSAEIIANLIAEVKSLRARLAAANI